MRDTASLAGALPCSRASVNHKYAEIVIYANTIAVEVCGAQVEHRLSIALLCSFSIPGDGLLLVLFNSFASPIHQAKRILGGCESLISGLAVPQKSILIALCRSISEVVSLGKCELSASVSSVCFLLDVNNVR